MLHSRVTSDNQQVLCKPLLLPGPLVARIILWSLIFSVFPLSVTAARLSFKVEVLGRTIAAAALPPGNGGLRTLAERSPVEGIVRYLETAERKESNRSFQADYRIALLTTSWCGMGIPVWCDHRESPFDAAVWTVLKCAPDHVWPNIVQQRRNALGPAYSHFYDADGNAKSDPDLEAILNSSPKKPVQSVRDPRGRRRA